MTICNVNKRTLTLASPGKREKVSQTPSPLCSPIPSPEVSYTFAIAAPSSFLGKSEPELLAAGEQGKVIASQAARSCSSHLTSCNLPVSMSKTTPRTGTSLAIQGCDRIFLICSRVCCSGSL